MARSVLVTGTDTGIGKTTATCALAAALAHRGLKVGVMKPVETGCILGDDGVHVPADGTLLRFFSGTTTSLDDICPIRFGEPLAPLVAARRSGRSIDIDALERIWRSIDAAHDLTFIEGAGGLLVPLAEGLTFADLADRWGLAVVVVVGNRLGAINHAALTLAHLGYRGSTLAGYIMNELSDTTDIATQTNAAILEEILGPALGRMPYLPRLQPDAELRRTIIPRVEGALDLDRIAKWGRC